MLLSLLLVIVGALPSPAGSDLPTVASYSLLPDSYLLDECPPCARPSIRQPLRGKFDLRLVEENPLFSRYAVEELVLTAGSAGGRFYKITGQGTYTVGGEVALIQNLELQLWIDDGQTNRLCVLTNATPQVSRLWPILAATVVQTNGTFTQVYEMNWLAAPLIEMWFSTAHGLTPGSVPPPIRPITGGDVLSSAGRVVKSNLDLVAVLNLSPKPPSTDLNVDAMSVFPGGEMVFSLDRDVLSDRLGWLREGDLLSDRGRIVHRNQDLTAALSQMPPAPDVGLDGVQVLSTGEIYFSVKQSFFSERLGRSIRAGDLLSNRGLVIRTQEQLLEKFKPLDPKRDYGLDAFYVWPSGEVWFSVETGFQGQNQEHYGQGDLLSDQGYLVMRNLELVAPFQPLEDLADFGLDGLFVIADIESGFFPPRFTRIHRSPGPLVTVDMSWEAKAHVWEVLRSQSPLGPWLSVSPLTTELTFTDHSAPNGRAYYRLRQW